MRVGSRLRRRKQEMTDQNMDAGSPAVADSLRALLHHLKSHDYAFVAVTPETHRRVLRHPAPPNPSLRDAFGWNRPFAEHLLPPKLLGSLEACGILERTSVGLYSHVRVATIDGQLYVHSSFPTEDDDAVFLGPDTYRFVRLLQQRLTGESLGRVADLGAGPGAGGLSLAGFATCDELVLVDVNPKALSMAAVNSVASGRPAQRVEASDLDQVGGKFDLVVANPPFIGGSVKTYSDGGGQQGADAPIAWTMMALNSLARGGRYIMYTGSPIRNGTDPVRAAAEQAARDRDAMLVFEEIDPDIFGSQLDDPQYAQVERIAAIAIDIRLPP